METGEILTAALGAGSENSRIALRLLFYFGTSMGTNYIYEWKQVGKVTEQPKETKPTPAVSLSPSPSPKPEIKVIRIEFPPPDDPEWETYSRELVKFGDMYGEINVKRYGEDDDAYIFAELDTPLHHGIVIRTHTRSGAILSFSDMSHLLSRKIQSSYWIFIKKINQISLLWPVKFGSI